MSVGISSAYNRPQKCCGRGHWSTLHLTRWVPVSKPWLSLHTLGRRWVYWKTEKERASSTPLSGLHLTSVLRSEGTSTARPCQGP